MRVVLLGVFMVMLMAMPVLAEKNSVDTDEDILSSGADDATFIPSGASADTIVASTESREGGSIDTQSPVLDGSAYTNYDTIFMHGTSAVAASDYDISSVSYSNMGFWIILDPKVYSAYPNAEIFCPLPSYQLKTGGVQPRVRYIAVEHMSLMSSGGHAWPEVYQVQVMNGPSIVKTIPITFSSTSTTIQIIDLEEWYAFNRGLSIVLSIRNGVGASAQFVVSDYAARFEW